MLQSVQYSTVELRCARVFRFDFEAQCCESVYRELVDLVVGECGHGALETRLEGGGAALDGPRLLADDGEPEALLEREPREVRAQQIPLERIHTHRLRLPVLSGA